MRNLQIAGRYIFAIPFLVFGINHFMYGEMMAGMVPIPGGIFWVYLTGLALVAASISLIIKKYDKLATLLLGIMLLLFALTVQLPGIFGANMTSSMANFLKDLALSGAAFYISGTIAKNE